MARQQLLYLQGDATDNDVLLAAGFDSKQLGVINPASRDFVVLAIRHNKADWGFNPHAEHTLHAGDVMMVMTAPQGRSRLEQLIQGVL